MDVSDRELVNEWRQLCSLQRLTPAIIIEHLRQTARVLAQSQEQYVAPAEETVYAHEPYWINEVLFKNKVQLVLESFICQDDPDQYLEHLKSTDNVSSVCGRVFKIGEPTYSCRECSMDGTCVLCSSCFKKSSHREHKYKMATSGGGGCCDCGDVEAWKRDPVCDDHNQSRADLDASNREATPLPEPIQQRCKLVFRAILDYCMRVLQVHGSLVGLVDEENSHCTILYNDETHTFEQVIQTLTSIVKCSQKDAVAYVTSIDRDGRAVVKCAPFDVCCKLKDDIENKAIRSSMGTKPSPLKVTVLHRDEVACQHLAMQILNWMQDFLTIHSTFRAILAEEFNYPTGMSYLRQIMSNDHKLWKSARTCWHRLLIAGMLMEYEHKKELATVFTRLYSSLMQDFIRDDHYHSFSIVSLSVQLFTVPSIAHYLIAQESAFFKLMHTFNTEAIDRHVKHNMLHFPKNTSSMNVFKRAAYILVDLKYLLNFPPEEGSWTQELRGGFLHGVQILIRLLKCMQGMDSATRQIGQHMEYEPEWETAFTLHLKLSHMITLVLEWCATDRIVLVKVYRMLLTALTEAKFNVQSSGVVMREVADHSVACFAYDVSLMPVSVHLPLTRLFAGLYLEMERYGLTYDTIAPNIPERPTPEQIIEPVLCARTMMSQVFANMWRRNGYALLNQLYFYRSVKCRYEMLDRDIVILQIGASLIEANEFLIHVLNKFKLLHWLANDQPETPRRLSESTMEEDHVRQTMLMADEVLELLIMIVSERYVPGVGAVTENDRIKKEVVQQLCIHPFSHSELTRAVSEDKYSETTIEAVFDEVAVFERPTAADKKGVYRLKPEYYSWYNLFFYHYSKEEKSKSEEMQRNRRKEQNELMCCPPPALPKLTQPFSIIPNLLQCDVMLEIINVVLTRAQDLKSITFSEGHLQRILHLIGHAIQEEESGYYPYLKFGERCRKINLLGKLEELVRSPRVESQRDLLQWVIQRYKRLDGNQSTEASNTEASQEEGEGTPSAEAEQIEKQLRAKMVAERRAKAMKDMMKLQQKFWDSQAAEFERECAQATVSVDDEQPPQTKMEWMPSTLTAPSTAPQQSIDGDTDALAQDAAAKVIPSTPVCMGPNRWTERVAEGKVDIRHTCILCSEDSMLEARSTNCLVYAAFVQPSSVLSRYQHVNEEGKLEYIEADIHPSPHITTCGHVMHANCFEKYFNNEVMKENRRPYRNRTPVLFDVEKHEFLCPLCRFLSNCLIPLIPPLDSVRCIPGGLKDPALHEAQRRVPELFDFATWYAFMSDFLDLMAEQQLTDEPTKPSVTPTPPQQHRRRLIRPEELVRDDLAIYPDFSDDDILMEGEAPPPADDGNGDDDGEPSVAPSGAAGVFADDFSPATGQIFAVYRMDEQDGDGKLPPNHYDSNDGDIPWFELAREPLRTAVLAKLEERHPTIQLTPAHWTNALELPRSCISTHVSEYLRKLKGTVGELITLPPLTKHFKDELAVWMSCSYTIKSLEMLLRVMERPLGSELSIRHSSCLRGLVRVSCVLSSQVMSIGFQPSLITYMLDIYERLFGRKPSPSFFDWDLFGILNTCLFMTHRVLFYSLLDGQVPRGNIIDQSIVQAVFLINVLRTLVTSTCISDESESMSDQDATQSTMEVEESEEDQQAIRNLAALYRQYNLYYDPTATNGTNAAPREEQEKAEKEGECTAWERQLATRLLRDIRLRSQTLLRCCCLLFHGITDIELPKCNDDVEHDFALMVTYLGIEPNPLRFFDSSSPSYAFLRRVADCNVAQIERMRQAREMQLLTGSLFRSEPIVRQLIDLPDDYSELINSISNYTCPNNIRDDSRNPTMCLVCGEVLCSQGFCCQKELGKSSVGSCTYHSHVCGAGIGIFLRVREAEVLILGIHKGCLIPAPYLDAYSETDQGLRRGNPLRLCQEHYRKLHLMWLSHGLHEEITRRNEAQQTIFPTQWQNL
uniref:E3 ubiquitin-protein ligase n=2 Tax=Anopheles triannulatus TaxID=58253 RepID=A0A2M4A3M0_9DIPT